MDFSDVKVEFSDEVPVEKTVAEVNEDIVVFKMIDEWIANNEIE